MVFLPHSNSFLPFAKAVLNHKQCKITLQSWGHDPTNPFYWVQSRFVVLHSKKGLQSYLLEVFESYPELEHSVNSQTSTPSSIWKYTSFEHLLDIIAVHFFSWHTSRGRHRIQWRWQRGLAGRQLYLLHPWLQPLAAPAAAKQGPGKVLRCSR